MASPRELFSRVLRPVQTEPEEPTPTPIPTQYGTTIERVEWHPDGGLTRTTFDPQRGERVEHVAPDDAASVRLPAPADPAVLARIERPS